jgi:DNA-binding CsgD family transcriptional regulator
MTIVISFVVPMARLSPRDLGQALDFLRKAEDVTGPDPFPVHMLEALRRLIPADTVSWHEWSVDDGRHHYSISTSDPDETAAVWHAYPQYRLQDPLPGGCPGAGPPSPAFIGRTLKISDFLSVREFRRLELHALVCRPLGVDYVMKLFLPNRNGVARRLVFDRGGRDFDERDRLLIDVLEPHFLQLEESARARRIVAALSVDAEASGVVVLDPLDHIEFTTAPAGRLLRKYADDRGGARLPAPLEAWLRRDRKRLNGADVPLQLLLTVERNGLRLLVRRAGNLLLLEEELASLTPREHEILDLVAEGRSNAEIAATLWISPGTVRIHLQHVYGKLGVRSRAAALARARDLLWGEGDAHG